MIDVGIVEDHALVRGGLKQFFASEADLHVAGEAGSGREAIEVIRKAQDLSVSHVASGACPSRRAAVKH